MTRGSTGYVVTYAAGAYAVLTVLATAEANLGRLHLEARGVADRIGVLVDAVEGAHGGESFEDHKVEGALEDFGFCVAGHGRSFVLVSCGMVTGVWHGSCGVATGKMFAAGVG